jgi:hypothetical protein
MAYHFPLLMKVVGDSNYIIFGALLPALQCGGFTRLVFLAGRPYTPGFIL